jgi:hypothetical protein
MNCTEFERTLADAIESRKSGDSSRLQAHAAGCDRCRREWENYAVLERAIPVWKSDTPETDLTEAVLANLPRVAESHGAPAARTGRRDAQASGAPNRAFAERANSCDARADRSAHTEADRPPRTSMPIEFQGTAWRQGSARQGLAVLVVVAGVLLLLARLPATQGPSSSNGPVGIRWQAHLDSADGGLAGRGDLPSATGPADSADYDQADVELASLLREARAAYWMLAADAVGAMADGNVLLPPAGGGRSPSDSTSDEQTIESLWNDGWERDLAPIGRGVGRGLGFLWDVVSLDSAPTT